jgi:dihydroflavonol-4-reductase
MTIQEKPLESGAKIFVTGGGGFLGAYIIKGLVEQGYTVSALRRNNKLPSFIPAGFFEKVEWITGDVLDTIGLEEAMEGMDAVIHAAAKVSFVSDERKEMLQTNIDGTANVVNAAIAQNIKRFIHISSVAALGRTADGETVSEDKQWQDGNLHTNYAISKYRAEMEVWRAIGEGLNAAIVNPGTIIGYGDWNTSSCAIFKSIYDEFPWYSNGINGFADVEDVAKAVILLLNSNITGERFILNGDNWSFRQLFNTIADGLGKEHPSKKATPLLAAIAWRMEKVKSFFSNKPSLLTKESARIAQTKTYFDNSKIQKYLPGFTFTPLEQTIRQACVSYLEQAKAL